MKCKWILARYGLKKSKMVKVMKLFSIFMFVFVLGTTASSFSQQQLVSLDMQQCDVSTLFKEIRKQTGLRFVYNEAHVAPMARFDVHADNRQVKDVLNDVFNGTSLKWYFENDVIYVVRQDNEKVKQDSTMIVKGVVRDNKGEALPGVTVLIKGTMIGVATDVNGKFVLGIPKKETVVLLISFVGYQTETVRLTQSVKDLEVRLKLDVKQLDEITVVSTGYQTVNRKDMVGAYTTVKAEDVMMPAYTSIDQMLQGKIAGMVVMNTSSRVGTSPTIRVRGTSTVLGNREPLWVVDGIIQSDPITIDGSDAMVDDLKNIIGNQIAWLNPADIETITVLKDASATAIYGSKAANGVIVITTKRGKVNRMTVNYTGNFTFRARPTYDMFNLMDSHERIQFSREAFEAGAVYASTPYPSMGTYEGIMQKYINRELTEEEAEKAIHKLESSNTNWLKLLTRNAFSHNHNLSFSGGTEKINYLASLGFSDEKGVELDNDARRLSGRVRIGIELHPKVHVDINLSGTQNKNGGYAAGVDPMQYALSTSRAVPAFDESGEYYFQEQRYKYLLNQNTVTLGYNVLNELENSYSKSEGTRLNGSMNFSWDILPWLKYELVAGINSSKVLSESFAGEETYYIASRYRGYDYGTVDKESALYKAAMLPFGGELYNSSSSINSWNVQNKIVISCMFGEDFRFNALLGTESISSTQKNRGMTTWGYDPRRGEQVTAPTPVNEIVPIGTAAVPEWGALNSIYNGGGWTRFTQTDNQFSIFGTLALAYKDRYVFNFSIRNDASNRFGQDQNKRLDPTYSFGLSWNVAEEVWMAKLNDYINSWNFRVTYGIQGNALNSISPDLIARQGGIKQYYEDYQVLVSRLPNPELSWERTKSWNVGMDLMLFNILSLNVEYYYKSSNNIINQDIPLEFGLTNMEINGGKITNSGMEYTLNITPVRTEDWGLTIGLNSSKNWNKAKHKSVDRLYLSDYLDGSSSQVLKEGYALSSFWSFDFKGLNPDTGYPEFNKLTQIDKDGNTVLADFNGDISDFLVYSGQLEPDFTGGLNFRLRWKNLTLGGDFSLLLGAKTRLASPYPSSNKLPESSVNLSRDLLKRWKQPGDEQHTIYPAVYSGRKNEEMTLPNGNSYSMYYLWSYSDALVVDASFLRCRQLSLSWRMQEDWCEKIGVQSLNVNFNLNNVFVIASKRFNGFDPELGNSVQPLIYSMGISVGF